jgi:hypothetical protein
VGVGGLKKGGNALRATDSQRCKSSASRESRYPNRIHRTWFCRLNEFLSPDFGYCTDSYVLIQYVSKIYVRLIRSTYVLYDNKYLRTYYMKILLRRNCTSFYESDEIVRFLALVGILEIYKMFNKSVKNYI